MVSKAVPFLTDTTMITLHCVKPIYQGTLHTPEHLTHTQTAQCGIVLPRHRQTIPYNADRNGHYWLNDTDFVKNIPNAKVSDKVIVKKCDNCIK
jgi:hypothetical protein